MGDSRVELSLEFRSPEQDQFNRLEEALREITGKTASRYGLGIQADLLHRHPPVEMDRDVIGSIKNASWSLGLSCQEIASGAGHDAQPLARRLPPAPAMMPSH